MPPPSVTEEVCCFPHCQLILSFDRCVIYNLKGLLRVHSKIDSIRPSVCTAIFKRIAGLHFNPKSFMLYINGFVSMSYTN